MKKTYVGFAIGFLDIAIVTLTSMFLGLTWASTVICIVSGLVSGWLVILVESDEIEIF
jgi:hypothetical protein